ncbi:MAG: undecaprenyldiphospho-muramoylpentapeptide beta-N-acetylglucosaminyltransferase [bacterium]|nr:undecaprenyldiphospho-muramoylpentapeptide beta-N-acetylglucosaminyltransferase [bacterium]
MSDARVRILITGGGTGGHVYPGLAVAEQLRRLAPGAEIRFVGTSRGIESTLVPKAGWPFTAVAASGFRGLGMVARLRFLVNFALGGLGSLGLLLRWRPAVVLGTGGYVSAPVIAAARLLGIACAVQEQNAIPGSVNRFVGRWARRVYLGFAGAARWFPDGRCVATGNPVRGAMAAAAEAEGRPLPAGGERHVLVFGGSGGAATLNRAVAQAAAGWNGRPGLTMLVQTGPREHAATSATVAAAAPAGNLVVVPYIDDMAGELARADLVVCRAGAMTLAELHCLGKPALLVPFPHATDNHQLRNARDCEEAGAAVVLVDDECDGPRLAAQVDALLADPVRLEALGRAARRLGRPHAAAVIAADVLALAGHAAGRAEPVLTREN